MTRILLTGHDLTLDAVAQVAYTGGATVALHPDAVRRMQESRAVVERAVAAGRVVYGVTTGFGRFADVAVPAPDRRALQQNLLRSHAAGVGDPLDPPLVRAMMLLRANALAKGYSGIRPLVVERLLALLAADVIPVIPRLGSVGASGDLAPLAHLALVLTGEGEAWWQGERLPGGEALRRAGIPPVELEAKEGLALINGTQLMTAHAALALWEAWRLADFADLTAALTVDVLRGIPDAYDDRVATVRPHPGQRVVAAHLQAALAGSRLLTRPGEIRVQDAYALRCVPQIHGASRDALEHVHAVVTREMNSATDNPLIFPDTDAVISAGNFHGQPVALALDYLAIALAELANVSERRSERLVNPALSGLPAFLVAEGGLHSGLMLAQYTAAALVSYNKVLAHPASVDSIPTSANQEDHVSMGSIGAVKVMTVLDNVRRVLAIEALLGAQAADLVGPERLGRGTRTLYDWVRLRVPYWDRDRELGRDITELASALVDPGPPPVFSASLP
jgi:histidine ammonia-lyase